MRQFKERRQTKRQITSRIKAEYDKQKRERRKQLNKEFPNKSVGEEETTARTRET